MNTLLDADQSAVFLTEKLCSKEPFFFIRYGDGAMECIQGRSGHTCDGEEYSHDLGAALLLSWVSVLHGSNVYLGDWLSACFERSTEKTRYEDFYSHMTKGRQLKWLHFEALLLMRESEQLVEFYRAVKGDSRKKLFMGPRGNIGAAEMLGADFLETPMSHLFMQAGGLTEELLNRDFEVLLYGAGMAGNIPVTRCWKRYPERTYVHLGSAFDPLFRGKTRRQQLHPVRARGLFSDFFKKNICYCQPCVSRRVESGLHLAAQ